MPKERIEYTQQEVAELISKDVESRRGIVKTIVIFNINPGQRANDAIIATVEVVQKGDPR